MALKAVLENLDGLDESLQALYTKTDNGFVLDLDGIDDHPATKGLKVVMEDQKKKTKAEQAKAKEALEALKKFDDLDPEAAREALKRVQELEDGHRMDQGEFKQLLEERIAEATSKVEKTMAAKMTELQTTNEGLTEEREGAVKALSRHKIGDAITQAALDRGVKKSLLRHLQRDALEVFSVREGEIGAWDKDDIPRTDSKGGVMTPDSWVTDYLTDNPDFAEPNSGSGAPGAGDRGGAAGNARFITPEQAGDNIEAIASGEAVIKG